MLTQQQEEEGDGGPVEQVCRGRCEVAVQWERPEGQWQEVGVQSQTQSSDVAVQVDLIGLSFAKPGSSDVPWRCVSVRAEEPGGGALWHCCLHSPSAPSAALLCPSATKTPGQEPDSTLETTLPSMQHSSPGFNQSGLSLPSMPICGDSPSSPGPNTIDPPDPPHDTPDASQPTPEATPEALGFMAPLSSDEEDAALSEHDEQLSPVDPPIKRRPGRPKNSATRRAHPTKRARPTTNVRRRNNNARQAGLPLRYQLDYDLESCDKTVAKQEPESDEGAGPGGRRDDKKKVLFLPYYKQSLDLGEFAEFQSIARRQYEALRNKQEEDDLQIDPSIVAHPGFERFMPRPLSPNRKQGKRRLVPLKLKKVKNGVSSRAPASRKKRNWSIENAAMEEERTDEESSDLTSCDWPRGKTRKIKEENLSEMEETGRDNVALGSKTAPDWSKCKRIAIKQEGNRAKSRKDGIWANQRKNLRKIFADMNAVEMEAGRGGSRVKRRPGRPRKSVEIKQEEIRHEIEQAFAVETDDEQPGSAEQSDRPRRKTVGPPVRYLLESEDPGARKRARARRFYEQFPEWLGEIKMEEFEDGGHFGTNGTIENLEDGSEMGVARQDMLKLGDVRSSSEGKGGLVKKVKILNDDMESAETYEDVQDLFVLRESEEDAANEDGRFWADQWKGPKGDREQQLASEERRRRRRRRERRDKETDGGGVHAELQRRSEFLVYRDEETGRTTFILPCFVKLQQLKE